MKVIRLPFHFGRWIIVNEKENIVDGIAYPSYKLAAKELRRLKNDMG